MDSWLGVEVPKLIRWDCSLENSAFLSNNFAVLYNGIDNSENGGQMVRTLFLQLEWELQANKETQN